MKKSPLFYHRRPIFGLDIGSQTVKAMQFSLHTKKAIVQGYGNVETDTKMIKDGVITDIPAAAKLVDDLLAKKFVGHLTTNRVVMGIPVARVFTRVLTLPLLSRKELDEAVRLEVEQSVPMPVKNLYYDYETTETNDPETKLVRLVAAPKAIVDSYVAVTDLLGLELSFVQTNIGADAELCIRFEQLQENTPYIIVDVGGNSIDLGVLDGSLRVTGTVEEGGNSLTKAIATKLNISEAKAQDLKVTKGLNASSHQAEIKAAVTPILDKVVSEIKKMLKFYEERIQPGSDISQILIFGGGANMPGFGEYLTDATRITTRVSSPWTNNISFGHLEPPEHADLPRFLTCAGLALTHDNEGPTL